MAFASVIRHGDPGSEIVLGSAWAILLGVVTGPPLPPVVYAQESFESAWLPPAVYGAETFEGFWDGPPLPPVTYATENWESSWYPPDFYGAETWEDAWVPPVMYGTEFFEEVDSWTTAQLYMAVEWFTDRSAESVFGWFYTWETINGEKFEPYGDSFGETGAGFWEQLAGERFAEPAWNAWT